MYLMASGKLNIAVLFGGKSPEHNISLLSARSVIDNLNRAKFDLTLIGIDRDGLWSYYGSEITFDNEGDPSEINLPEGGAEIYFSQSTNEHAIISKESGEVFVHVDVVFPVLHGLHGEDGSMQGLMKLAGLPCVGCDVLGSAVCMDKDVAKRLMRDGGIPVADFVTLRRGYNDRITYQEIANKLGAELYIKPVNLGSSVGVSFVNDEVSFKKGVTEAFRFDTKVLVESKVVGREIECAVLGNETPEASAIGEVAPTSEFYTFDSKYLDKDDAKLSIPADISKEVAERAREQAIAVFRMLECKGFARVDMFLTEDGGLIMNEVNTIPGFTSISMYPKLWEYSGLPYQELLSTLIDLAIENQVKVDLLL